METLLIIASFAAFAGLILSVVILCNELFSKKSNLFKIR